MNSLCVHCHSIICVGRNFLDQSSVAVKKDLSFIYLVNPGLFCSSWYMEAYDESVLFRIANKHLFLKCSETKFKFSSFRHATKIVFTAGSFLHKYLQPPRYIWSGNNLKLFKQVKVTEYLRYSPALRWRNCRTWFREIFRLQLARALNTKSCRLYTVSWLYINRRYQSYLLPVRNSAW